MTQTYLLLPIHTHICPTCRAFGSLTGGLPPFEPGDEAVCAVCGEISIVGDDLNLRKPSAQEQLDADRRINELPGGLGQYQRHGQSHE
jgi:hypothetical protein